MYLGICISEDSTAPEDMSAYQWCRISYGKEVEGLQQTAGQGTPTVIFRMDADDGVFT